MQARNRSLREWLDEIVLGQIMLPRFQRYEAWDRNRITSLIDTVTSNLPLGIALVMDVNTDEEKFISRHIATAPEAGNRVLEYLLDGQQRLTAIWRVLQNNYDQETYFIYVRDFDQASESTEDEEEQGTHYESRHTGKNGKRYPLWCDEPDQCLWRGFIPTELLAPGDIGSKIEEWIDAALGTGDDESTVDEIKELMTERKLVSDKILAIRSVIANYNLPYLALPASTDKSVALDVFIKMNTNTQPLSQFDVIVAEVESVTGKSLHDIQDDLTKRHPEVAVYDDISSLLLSTSALLQGYAPNQRGSWDMSVQAMIDNWSLMESGLVRMAAMLASEGIFDKQRLPTKPILPVLAALLARVSEKGDKRGKDELLIRRYMWRAFFSDRYESATASRAYADYSALTNVMNGEVRSDGSHYEENDVPIFFDHEIYDLEDLKDADWPRKSTILGRAILAVTCHLGAMDFASGTRVSADNIGDRQYHHIFPDALLKEAGIPSYVAMNCALISDTTNMSIGRKDPLRYLKDRYEWVSGSVVAERLGSHLIPENELANGGYEKMSDPEKVEKLKTDFSIFVHKRAQLIHSAAVALVAGKQVDSSTIMQG